MAKQKRSDGAARAKRRTLSLWGKVAVILVCAVVLGLVLTPIVFFSDPAPAYVTAKLQLTFEGAAEGTVPDGYTFNVQDLTSDEVIEAALRDAALDGIYTAEQIRTGLVITGNYPEDLANQTMSYDSLLNFTANRTLTVDRFHPTLFNVTLYDHFDKTISRANLEKILHSLLGVYQSHFAKVNVQGAPSDGNQMEFNLPEYDYPQQLQILQERMQIISAYAEEMYEREPTFRYAGSSFNDIIARITSIQDSDIGRLNANMTLNALTKDPKRLITQYEFELRDLNNQLSRRLQQLSSVDTLIDSYEKSEILYISTAESLTKIDGNSSATYDQLVAIRKRIAEDNTEIRSKIADYSLKLSDLTGETYVIESREPAENADERSPVTEVPAIADPGVSENDPVPVIEDATATSSSENEDKAAGTKKVSEEVMRREREAFEAEITALEEKCDAVVADFSEMVKAWNASKLNDLTVTVSGYRYSAPGILSGAFIATAIKTVGPIGALAVIVCLCMIIAAKKREEKEK